VTHFASPGVSLDALVVVDQKANPTYPGFYNGGGSRHGAWPGGLRNISLAVGCRDRAPVGVMDDPPETEAKYEITIQLLTFSCRKFRIY